MIFHVPKSGERPIFFSSLVPLGAPQLDPSPPGADRLRGKGYRILGRLGAGGMAEVYDAIHVGLNKPVVIKVLLEAIARETDAADRLRIEAQTLASIDSPYLVAVSDIGVTDDGRPFFVMEKLRGKTLREALESRKQVHPLEAIQWTTQILTGLATAHRMGIVHRDVKLDNAFLCDGTVDRPPVVKLLDFGIAKVLGRAGLPFPAPAQATEEGRMLGTPRYLSPEQIRFDEVDERADVYATGIVLFTLIAGRGPFHEQRGFDLIDAHLSTVPPLLSTVAPTRIPPDLDRAVAKALAKAPSERFPSADAFARELVRIAGMFSPARESRELAPDPPAAERDRAIDSDRDVTREPLVALARPPTDTRSLVVMVASAIVFFVGFLAAARALGWLE